MYDAAGRNVLIHCSDVAVASTSSSKMLDTFFVVISAGLSRAVMHASTGLSGSVGVKYARTTDMRLRYGICAL